MEDAPPTPPEVRELDEQPAPVVAETLDPEVSRRLRRIKLLGQALTVLGLAATLGGAAALVWLDNPFVVGALVGLGGGLVVSSAAVLIYLGQCPACGSALGAQFDNFCTHCGVRLRS